MSGRDDGCGGCTRRQFLFRGAAGGAAAVAAAALPGCAPGVEPAPFVDVPAPVGGRLALRPADHPELARVGGAVTARAPGLDPPVLVVRSGDGSFAALSSICTHRGCPVGVEDLEVVCPCHASRFGLDGRVLRAPATQGLTRYATSYDPAFGELAVDLAPGDPGFPRWEGGAVVLPLDAYPQLRTPGGSVVGRPGGAPRAIALLVAALPGGGFAATSAICTHLGCTVGFDVATRRIECPCHGSVFSTEGAVLNGPATRPLERFDVRADAAAVTVLVPA